MERYNVNDVVVIVKENDKNEGKECRIIEVTHLVHFPVTIYRVEFEDGSKGDYFFADIWHK